MVTYPDDWAVYAFDEMFQLYPNNTLSRDKLSEHGTIGDVHYGDVLIKYGSVLTGKDSIPKIKEEYESLAKTRLQKNDVIIADTAEDETVGKAVQIGDVPFPIVGGLHTVICRPLVATATGYLGYYMNSREYHNQLLPYIAGIKVSSISKTSLRRTEFHIPSSVDEQAAIVDTIERFDTHISNLAALIEKKRAVRDAALEDLVSGRTRLDGFSGEWKRTTLGKEYHVTMGQSPPSSSYNSSKNGLPLVQGNADIKNGITVPERYTSMPARICEAGAVLLSVRAPIGTVSRANQTVCLGRGVCALNGSNNDFIYQMMKYYESAWATIGQGSTFTAITGKDVRNFQIRIPDEQEQDAIAGVLTAMDDEIQSLEAERDKMTQIREGVMDDLLTGRKRLN